MYTSSKTSIEHTSLESQVALGESIMLLIGNYLSIHGTTQKSICEVLASLELNKSEFDRRIINRFMAQAEYDVAPNDDPFEGA